MRIVLIGPPGSGKGTQAALLAERLEIPAVSTGELFRAHIDSGTELGRRTAAFTTAGDLVPDDLTLSVVAERLGRPDCRRGYLLDGFPRTLGQAERLRDELAARGTGLDAVVELAVGDEELVRRMSTRRVLVDGVWTTRADDAPETVRHRLKVYRELTAPLVDFYRGAGLLVRVDAGGAVADVAARVLAALGGPSPRTAAMDVLSSRVLLRPADAARSQAFYRDVLGLAVYREFGPPDHPGIVFFLGNGLLEVSGRSEEPPAGLALWLQVRDVATEHDRLARAGVTIIQPPRQEPWGLIEMWIDDPDGVRICLVEVPEDHPLRRDQR